MKKFRSYSSLITYDICDRVIDFDRPTIKIVSGDFINARKLAISNSRCITEDYNVPESVFENTLYAKKIQRVPWK